MRPDDDDAFCFLIGIHWQSSKSDASGSVTSDSWWALENSIGHPMLGLDSLGLGHRTVEPDATGLPVPGHLGNAIGRPMLGLVLLSFDIGLLLFLRLRSTMSSFHVALQPARELFAFRL